LLLFFLFNFSLTSKIFADEKAALEARHQDCTSSVDVAKQLDDRDAAHKSETDQLKSRIAELLEEKEQREGQLKKAQDLLVTSEADAAAAHAELDGLKEQATKWEVAVAQLNADLARKLQILFPYSADIPIRHNFLLQHIFSGITLYRYTILLLTCSPCFRHVSCFR
jgi:septal ring factor EnvC (AmiA/AmiB activator)